jgi:simple sugar transport system ATP-binding protein
MDTVKPAERVRMKAIRKRYGMVEALRGVTLRLAPGEVLGLVGDNAAGKSTLMKVLSGAVVPDDGHIVIDNDEVHFSTPRDARERRIEMVYQDLSLCEHLDVARNLFLGREPTKFGFLDETRMHAEAREHLESLRIKVPSTKVSVSQLSGGQRQVVAIARAATFAPKVLIMDEPTSALAVREVEMVLELICTLSAQNVSVILITHRLQDLFVVCDRIMVMFEGEVRADDLDAERTTLEEIVRYIVGQRMEKGTVT